MEWNDVKNIYFRTCDHNATLRHEWRRRGGPAMAKASDLRQQPSDGGGLAVAHHRFTWAAEMGSQLGNPHRTPKASARAFVVCEMRELLLYLHEQKLSYLNNRTTTGRWNFPRSCAWVHVKRTAIRSLLTRKPHIPKCHKFSRAINRWRDSLNNW